MSDGYFSFQMKWPPQPFFSGDVARKAVISPALLMYLLPRDRLDGFITFVARPIYPFDPLFAKFYDLSLANKKYHHIYLIRNLLHTQFTVSAIVGNFCLEMKANIHRYITLFFSPKRPLNS